MYVSTTGGIADSAEGQQNLCSEAGFILPVFHCPHLCQVLKDPLAVKGEEIGTLVVLESSDHVQASSLE